MKAWLKPAIQRSYSRVLALPSGSENVCVCSHYVAAVVREAEVHARSRKESTEDPSDCGQLTRNLIRQPESTGYGVPRATALSSLIHWNVAFNSNQHNIWIFCEQILQDFSAPCKSWLRRPDVSCSQQSRSRPSSRSRPLCVLCGAVPLCPWIEKLTSVPRVSEVDARSTGVLQVPSLRTLRLSCSWVVFSLCFCSYHHLFHTHTHTFLFITLRGRLLVTVIHPPGLDFPQLLPTLLGHPVRLLFSHTSDRLYRGSRQGWDARVGSYTALSLSFPSCCPPVPMFDPQ